MAEPTDYRAAYRKLRDSILRFQMSHAVGTRDLIRGEDWEARLRHLQKDAARALGLSMLEHGLIDFSELKPTDPGESFMRPGQVELRSTAWVVPPGECANFEARLRDAYEAGYLAAIAKLQQSADAIRDLRPYGPVQALALDGVARELRAQLPIRPLYRRGSERAELGLTGARKIGS